jgi:phospholipase/carboxylesterase
MSGSPPLRVALDVPDGSEDGATVAVLLHGRGSHGRELLGLRAGLSPDTILVTPQAPHAAAPWGYGPGWAWYRYLGEDRIDETTLAPSLDALGDVLRTLENRVPVRPGAVVLGGFSQGGTTSLAYALRNPGHVDGVINLSGFLADGLLDQVGPKAARNLRVFWGHGTGDPAIPHQLAERGRRALLAAGTDLESHDYGMGHAVIPEELADVSRWMASVRKP